MTTLMALPAKPTTRTLLLFAHYDPMNVVDPYVVHLVRALADLPATVVFVSASQLTSEAVEPVRDYCEGIYTRENRSFDPGNWHFGWRAARDHGWSLAQFDRFVLVNDSIYGPLFPLEEMWNSFEGADMYGGIESLEHGSHLQATFLAWDINPATRRFLEGEWNCYSDIDDKVSNIVHYEVGWSTRAAARGLALKPYVSAINAKRAYAAFPDHPWTRRMTQTDQVNHALFFWDGLIEQFRYPFLKVRVLQPGWPGSQWGNARWREVIEARSDYPAGLISAHAQRWSSGSPALIPAFP